jgi:hypothetical protein
MQLVIKNGFVVATHTDTQDIVEKYPGCDIVFYIGEFKMDANGVLKIDPRTPEEKLNDYQSKRRLEYPSLEEQLDLLYWDKVNKTKVWEDTIAVVKAKYPKPS